MVRLDTLLVRWSRAFNLTGLRTEEARFERYFAESLQAIPKIPPTARAADIGSGGGNPALPLAIACPRVEWTLVEPNKKKCLFLEEAARTLGIPNVQVRNQRYESFEPEHLLEVVTSRGIRLERFFLPYAGAWLEDGGRLLLFTGSGRAEQLCRELDRIWRVESLDALEPRQEAWLLVLEKRGEACIRSASGGG